MTLTSLIRIIFRDKKSYEAIPVEDKRKHFFMINKIFSRIYPIAANSINVNGIDTAIGVDIWFDNLKGMINIPPMLEPQYHLLSKKSKKVSGTSENYILRKYFPELIIDIKPKDSVDVVVMKKLKKKK